MFLEEKLALIIEDSETEIQARESMVLACYKSMFSTIKEIKINELYNPLKRVCRAWIKACEKGREKGFCIPSDLFLVELKKVEPKVVGVANRIEKELIK